MPNYRRAFIPGGTWFFTVNLLQRHGNDLLVREINLLRNTVRRVREQHPFRLDAWVVLPEHLHCVMTLPPGDSDEGCNKRSALHQIFSFSHAAQCPLVTSKRFLYPLGIAPYVNYPKPSAVRKCARRQANVAYGKGIIGNI